MSDSSTRGQEASQDAGQKARDYFGLKKAHPCLVKN